MNRGTGEAFAKLAQELNRARIRATAGGGGGGGRSGGGGGLPGGGFAAGGAGLAVLAVGAIVVGNYCLFNGEYLIAGCFSLAMRSVVGTIGIAEEDRSFLSSSEFWRRKRNEDGRS